ncbi:6615_t:CDS:2 [Scutellospora calospora]|uniref:6615_t:CDS:1 n=1 Tax=Scutellospora calospora TaxID=85575 RepID=A0ACA9MDU5_9GLOM|nr:6615_t:CDS:2 [Scutellospora calospora]
MTDDINAERVPLLETQEDQNPVDYKEQCCCCLFSITMIVFLIIAIFLNSSLAYSNLSTDVSKIPYDYRLRYKTFLAYDLVIEGYPTEFKSDDSTNDNKMNYGSNQPELVKYAEIIVPYWTYGNFNVIEFRYYPNGSIIPVLTVNSRIDGYLTNEIDIVFTASDNNSTLGLEACQYRISWTWLFNGYIWRQCKKDDDDSDFKKIAYFKGHAAWGLTFLSVDEKIKYGYSSASLFFWNLYARDIFIDPTAPFPPIIPALYTAYYNYLERLRQRNSNKPKDPK